MKKALLFIFLSFGLSFSQPKVIKFAELEQVIAASKAKLVLVNFWATWCAPCIAELPHFQAINQKNVEVVFVSLDFVKDKEKWISFVKKRDFKQKNFLLNEPDYDAWIGKVHQDWSGSIPATVFIKKGKKTLVEKPLNKDDLNQQIKALL